MLRIPGRRRDRGAAAIEFAIVFPLLFLVLAGIIDFGRAFFIQVQLANSAREGARAAVVLTGAATPAPAISARALAAVPAVPSPTVGIVSACPSGSTAYATVDVSAPIQWIFIGPALSAVGGSWGASGVLTSRGVMQCGG